MKYIIMVSILLIIFNAGYTAELSVEVDGLIRHDKNGKYIIVSLINKTNETIKTPYWKDEFYGDILIGNLHSMKRYANNHVMEMKLSATYTMPELILSIGEKYEYKIYEKDTVAWESGHDGKGDQIRKTIEFVRGRSIIVTYPRFGCKTISNICSSEINIEDVNKN